jgi:hypothetical protein
MNTEKLNLENNKLPIFGVSDSVIQKFISTKKYKGSFVNITLQKEKYKTVGTSIGTDELLKDFVDFIKHYH